MTKNDLIIEIAKETGFRQVKVKRVVQLLFDSIINALARESRIELRNFGVFEVKTRRPRSARNPRTNEIINVPARKMVKFKSGKRMKNIIKRTAS